jgi:hypothetical protein
MRRRSSRDTATTETPMSPADLKRTLLERPSSGPEFPSFPESDFKNSGALRPLLLG